MSKILVIGADGQLGQCLKAVSSKRNIDDIYFASRSEGDILDLAQLNFLFDKEKPNYVINCAAYTAVDQAEDEQELCKAINEDGALNLAKACLIYKATLIHVSTDFVFEGNEVKLLKEVDITEPINVYGQTKLAGEKAIATVLEQYIIIRTSWLYSEYANNFVKTMLRLGSERSELNVISDQVGSPTYAIDLANVIIDIIESKRNSYGTFHFSNEGVTSWYDFAKAIFDISKTEVKLEPIPGSAYPTKAKRPSFSVMDKTKIKETFNLSISYWRDSLATCINQLNKNNN